jgi:hypothetical protein
MTLMVRAGFEAVFVGIETPNEDSLAECGKLQNRNRDLVASIRRYRVLDWRLTGDSLWASTMTPPRSLKSRSS